MKGLDYSKFKKIASDKNSTTLKHKDGHELKIAHSKLSDEHRGALERLPMAKGGEVRRYAEGTADVEPNQSVMPEEPTEVEPKSEPKPEEHSIVKSIGEAVGKHAVAPVIQGIRDTADAYSRIGKGVSEGAKNLTSGVAEGAGFQPQAETPPPIDQAASQPDQGLAPTPPQAPSLATQPGATSQELQPSQPAPETPKQDIQAADKTKDPAQAGRDMHALVTQENANFARDIQEGHIQPHQYSELFDRKDTLGKISSVFGLILSGASSALTLNPTPLMNFMDREINRDLQAQMKSNENAQNWYRLNQGNLKNLADVGRTNVETDAASWALSQSHMLQASLDKLSRDTKNMSDSDPRKPAANQILAMMHPMIAEKSQNAATIAASAAQYQKLLFGGNQPSGSEAGFKQQVQGLRMLGPMGEKRAEDLESKHYPGFKGQASIPLSQDDRNKFEAGTNFDQKLDRFTKWAKDHSGSLDPRAIVTGRAMSAELSSAYREAIHGGVYKPGEQSFIGQIIDEDPTKFFNKVRVIPKLEAVKKEHLAKMQNFAKSKGFESYNPGTGSEPGQPESDTIERFDPRSGKMVIFDAGTKKPLRFK